MRTIFGREPAYWGALAASTIQLFSAFVLPLNIETQGVLNAAIAAGFGVITAFQVRSEKTVPAVVGFFKAAIAVGLAFGLSLSPEAQSSFLVFAEILLTGFLVRPNVVAKVPLVVDGKVLSSVNQPLPPDIRMA